MLLEDLQVVLKVAEFRSITAAAAALDMRTATASAALKRVENTLGVELFIRTTRSLRLSNSGERYIPKCKEALTMLDMAKLQVKDELDVVDGELRIAVSSDLGRNLIAPWLDEFIETYPKVSLKLILSDSPVDFYRDTVDIALRYGSPDDANLYGFKICNTPGLLCATQNYLDKYGTPTHPHDLPTHKGLFYQLNDIVYDVWTFQSSEQDYKIKMSGGRSSNDGDMVRRWCVAGKGLAVKSSIDIADDLFSGKVVPVMPEYRPRTTELWMICPSRQLITPAARLLRDMLKKKCTKLLKQLIQDGFLDNCALE